MPIRYNARSISKILFGGREIKRVYCNLRVVWEKISEPIDFIKSCFGTGRWRDEYKWTDNNKWKDNYG